MTPEADVLTTRSAIFWLVWPHHSKAPSAHLSFTVILGVGQGEERESPFARETEAQKNDVTCPRSRHGEIGPRFWMKVFVLQRCCSAQAPGAGGTTVAL